MRAARAGLLATLLAAVPIAGTAQLNDPLCQTTPQRMIGYSPANAQQSFPTLVRNTFAQDGSGPEALDVSVHLPGTLTPDCPGGTVEPMRGIRSLGGGRYEGYVVHNSLSSHSHLFGETFAFTQDQVWDWQLPDPAGSGQLYGAYRLRWTLTYRSVDGGSIMIQLMPDILPPDWR